MAVQTVYRVRVDAWIEQHTVYGRRTVAGRRYSRRPSYWFAPPQEVLEDRHLVVNEVPVVQMVSEGGRPIDAPEGWRPGDQIPAPESDASRGSATKDFDPEDEKDEEEANQARFASADFQAGSIEDLKGDDLAERYEEVLGRKPGRRTEETQREQLREALQD